MKNLLSKSLSLLMVFLLSSVCLFAKEVKLSKRATYVGEVANKLPNGAGELTYFVNKTNNLKSDKTLLLKGVFEMSEKQKGVIKDATIIWLDWTIQAENVSFTYDKKKIAILFSDHISMSINTKDGTTGLNDSRNPIPYRKGNYVVHILNNDLKLELSCFHDVAYQPGYYPNTSLPFMWFSVKGGHKSYGEVDVICQMDQLEGRLLTYNPEYFDYHFWQYHSFRKFYSDRYVEEQKASIHANHHFEISAYSEVKNDIRNIVCSLEITNILCSPDPTIEATQFFNPSYVLSSKEDTIQYDNGLKYSLHPEGRSEYIHYTFDNGDFIELSWNDNKKAIYKEHYRLTLNNGIVIENDPWDNQNDWIPNYHITYPNGDKYVGTLFDEEDSPLSIGEIWVSRGLFADKAKFNFDMVPKLQNGTYTYANGQTKDLFQGQTEEEARLEEEAAQKAAQEYRNNLVRKYGQQFSQAILKQEVIIGMTKEMLYEMDYKWERTYKSQGEYATYEKYKGARKGELEEYQVAAFLFGNTSDISTAQALYEYEKSLYIYVELRNNKVVEVEQR